MKTYKHILTTYIVIIVYHILLHFFDFFLRATGKPIKTYKKHI